MIINYFPRKLFRKSFNSKNWKRDRKRRKYYIDDIVDNIDYLGKNRVEIEELLGPNESYNIYLFNRWSYFVENRNKRKFYLAIYFENDKVAKIKYENNI